MGSVKHPHLTKNYARFRILDPKRFVKESMRTQKLGTHGTKRITGELKTNGEYATQAILIPRARYAKGDRVKMKDGRPIIVHKKKRK
jgi:hypothetical protein